MTTLFSQVIDFMDSEDFRYEIIEGETVLRFYMVLKSARYMCRADVNETKNWVIFYSYLPVNIPPAKLRNVAEFICRANYGLCIGNFELDYNDGEVRYKTSIDVEGGELVLKMVDNLLRANLSTMDRYLPGLMKIIYADMTPKDAIASIEDFDFRKIMEQLETGTDEDFPSTLNNDDDNDDDDDSEIVEEEDSEVEGDDTHDRFARDDGHDLDNRFDDEKKPDSPKKEDGDDRKV